MDLRLRIDQVRNLSNRGIVIRRVI
jgi:hypothetical protein